ncbi:MAG: 30S ribosomal protein S6 [Deltaproteobacteria bacterium]|nr:30S ribosomal protein S6 [Deltaproteobacteria bacterium]
MTILNEYETTYVARPDLTDDQMNKITEKIEGVVKGAGGTMLVTEDWGKRKLAYLINRHQKGHYIYLNYCGPSPIINEVERNLRLEDNLLRFLTVKIEDDVEPETRRVLAEERKRMRIERMAALKAEEEAEARYRAEAEEEDGDLGDALDE